MREHLYRGKRVYNGEWVYGGISYFMGGTPYICPERFSDYDEEIEVLPDTVCEYTGLTDKNGNKIFEGDILEWAEYRMEIYWGEDVGVGYGFMWRSVDGTDYCESITGFIDEYEVIGNIHDNPELLENKRRMSGIV